MNRPLSRIPRIGAAIGADYDIEADLNSINGDDLLDAMEVELSEIEGDIDAAEDPYEIGAVAARAARHAGKQARLQTRAAGGGFRSQAAARKLLNMAQRQERAFAKLNRKQHRLAQKYGVSPGAVGAVGVRGIDQRSRLSSESQAYAEAGQIGQFRRSAFAGTEVRIPFLRTDGHPTEIITISGGARSSAPIALQTEQIPYAGFIVRGLDVSVKVAKNENAQGFPQQDVLWNLLLKSAKVNGNIDLIYPPAAGMPVEFTAQGASDNYRSSVSLRANPELQLNNRATLTADFWQEVAVPNDYWAIVSFALVCEVLDDSAARGQF